MKKQKLKQKRLQQKKELKIIFWIVTIGVLITGWGEYLFKNIAYASAPYARQNNSFPIASDKQNLTDKDKIFIASAKECWKRDLGNQCIKDLQGIANKETRFKCDEIGDQGNSYGCYQIHRGYHPEITVEQARDPKFATAWTLNRLIAYNYPEYRSTAIRRHNGSPTNPKTLKYLQGVNSFALN